MTTTKLDFRKEQPVLYGGKPGIINTVDVPAMKFLMVDGKGDPNTAQEYKDAVETLYAVSYGVKMPFKKKYPAKDYVVPPLEGLWYMKDMSRFVTASKSEWLWTMMVRVPDYVPEGEIIRAIAEVKHKKDLAAIDQVRLEHLTEGKCVQALHVGPYDDEAPLIKKMHAWIKDNGHEPRLKHHEIYISDVRKVALEKLKTVLRQPFS